MGPVHCVELVDVCSGGVTSSGRYPMECMVFFVFFCFWSILFFLSFFSHPPPTSRFRFVFSSRFTGPQERPWWSVVVRGLQRRTDRDQTTGRK